MQSYEIEAVKNIIRKNCGNFAAFRQYDRSLRSPLNLVLDEAQKQLSGEFVVFWVENGLPENFFLSGFSATPVIYNTRFVELAFLIRKIMVEDSLSLYRVELTERMCLKIMAEFCLQKGWSDLAVHAFAKSVLNKSIHILDSDILMMLEYEPKHEPYMLVWFYGLAHELGHVFATEIEQQPDGKHIFDHFSDNRVLTVLDAVLERFEKIPDEWRQRAKANARKTDSTYFLSPHNLRGEMIADSFAINILLHSTIRIMQIDKTKQFRIDHFVAEAFMLQNVIWIVERCQNTVQHVSATVANMNDVMDSLFHPVSVSVRSTMLIEFLDLMVSQYLFDIGNYTKEQSTTVSELISSIVSFYQAIDDVMETGLAKAMRFILFADERNDNLLERFQDYISRPSETVAKIETMRFCKLAQSYEVSGGLLDELQSVI